MKPVTPLLSLYPYNKQLVTPHGDAGAEGLSGDEGSEVEETENLINRQWQIGADEHQREIMINK